ncbi:hypothetical protein COCMIDRAFT_452 [Bipolaris oryzae ATCC 44560]|uniref:Uncharacterized protein n=1 Tax=Bipolaris oryzae ATCC 44560 TaxID=930090 RepID=W6ZLF7_COCMI|nr:uncharacterized protein COCMIDRAFT_452 [Bipolaris oryzae ATCC 44560]EUC50905.1 hypothetical protein COCMIDRAFT_452 [Bipolaris oryzae ATCC 44560]
MPADVHLIEDEGAYEPVPTKGQNGLRFPVERYLPPNNFINFDDEINYHQKLLYIARNINRNVSCLRCGIPTGQHPKDLGVCQWCGGAADGGHPHRECLWIYANVSFWKSKLKITDPTSGQKSSSWVPVNVRIQPTKKEQTLLAREDPIFLDFPRARESRDMVVPDGANMMQPVLIPRKFKNRDLNRGEKRQRGDDNEASERSTRRPFVSESDKYVELKAALFRELKDELFHELSRMREKIARLSEEVTELRAVTEKNRENQFPSSLLDVSMAGFLLATPSTWKICRPVLATLDGKGTVPADSATSMTSTRTVAALIQASIVPRNNKAHLTQAGVTAEYFRSAVDIKTTPVWIDALYIIDNNITQARAVEKRRKLFDEQRLQSTPKAAVHAAGEQQSFLPMHMKRECSAEPHWPNELSRSSEYGRTENRGTLAQQRNDRINRDQASLRSPPRRGDYSPGNGIDHLKWPIEGTEMEMYFARCRDF